MLSYHADKMTEYTCIKNLKGKFMMRKNVPHGLVILALIDNILAP